MKSTSPTTYCHLNKKNEKRIHINPKTDYRSLCAYRFDLGYIRTLSTALWYRAITAHSTSSFRERIIILIHFLKLAIHFTLRLLRVINIFLFLHALYIIRMLIENLELVFLFVAKTSYHAMTSTKWWHS